MIRWGGRWISLLSQFQSPTRVSDLDNVNLDNWVNSKIVSKSSRENKYLSKFPEHVSEFILSSALPSVCRADCITKRREKQVATVNKGTVTQTRSERSIKFAFVYGYRFSSSRIFLEKMMTGASLIEILTSCWCLSSKLMRWCERGEVWTWRGLIRIIRECLSGPTIRMGHIMHITLNNFTLFQS